jgi:hypothetical protein
MTRRRYDHDPAEPVIREWNPSTAIRSRER